jgi:hypothetical protein
LAQLTWVRTWQVLLEKQQAPVGVGQVTEAQVTELPWYVPPPEVQAGCVTVVHAPLVQHAPVGCGQGFGEQAELSPWYVPVQADWVDDWHVPAAAQHAPVAGGRQPRLDHLSRRAQSPLGRQPVQSPKIQPLAES